MIDLFLLIPFLIAGLFSKEPVEPPTVQEIEEQTRKLLDTANRRQDVQRYCEQNPDSLYSVEIQGITIVVRCKSWWEWRSRQHG